MATRPAAWTGRDNRRASRATRRLAHAGASDPDAVRRWKTPVFRDTRKIISIADSPALLATFIYEKFQTWSDNKGDPEDALSTTAMLDDISSYWLTRSGASSGRFYRENPGNGFAGPRIGLPVAVSVFPREIYQVPRSWAEHTFPNLIDFGELDRGGHFAAMEQPVLFASELRKAFASLR